MTTRIITLRHRDVCRMCGSPINGSPQKPATAIYASSSGLFCSWNCYDPEPDAPVRAYALIRDMAQKAGR